LFVKVFGADVAELAETSYTKPGLGVSAREERKLRDDCVHRGRRLDELPKSSMGRGGRPSLRRGLV